MVLYHGYYHIYRYLPRLKLVLDELNFRSVNFLNHTLSFLVLFDFKFFTSSVTDLKFSGHPIQTLIVMSTIICEIGFVFGCFFLVGLELGAVEVRTYFHLDVDVSVHCA